jgi:hypothetical protein
MAVTMAATMAVVMGWHAAVRVDISPSRVLLYWGLHWGCLVLPSIKAFEFVLRLRALLLLLPYSLRLSCTLLCIRGRGVAKVAPAATSGALSTLVVRGRDLAVVWQDPRLRCRFHLSLCLEQRHFLHLQASHQLLLSSPLGIHRRPLLRVHLGKPPLSGVAADARTRRP